VILQARAMCWDEKVGDFVPELGVVTGPEWLSATAEAALVLYLADGAGTVSAEYRPSAVEVNVARAQLAWAMRRHMTGTGATAEGWYREVMRT